MSTVFLSLLFMLLLCSSCCCCCCVIDCAVVVISVVTTVVVVVYVVVIGIAADVAVFVDAVIKRFTTSLVVNIHGYLICFCSSRHNQPVPLDDSMDAIEVEMKLRNKLRESFKVILKPRIEA